MRVVIDGIRWRVRTGSRWRDMPEMYSPWQALYRWFRRWQRAGVWAQILASLQAQADAAGLIGWTVGVDSTISRAHQHAAGARRDGDEQKEPPGPAERAGRSRARPVPGRLDRQDASALRTGPQTDGCRGDCRATR
ncbi:transposase [Actinoplanes sp. NPDC048988]|uniref:transposase n=1 Tax=Actinoplanes sp. NPDC048988 TaxID=3363901 RepID=UPI00371CBDC8